MSKTVIHLTAERHHRALAELRQQERNVLEALELLTMLALTGAQEGIDAGMITLKLELRIYQSAIAAAQAAGLTPELDKVAESTLNDLLPARRNAR